MTGSDFHSSDEIRGTLGKVLEDKKIVLCVSGSVAAYKAIDLARLLMRHGANVFPVMSSSATMLLHPNYLHWATGNDVVTKLSAKMEHIKLADFGRSDLIILYPTTANTIGKFANGIDDNALTSILSVGLGSKIPIFVAPAMHEAMYCNQLVIDNIIKLKKQGIIFLEPIISEGKAKIIPPNEALKAILDFTKTGNKVTKKVLSTKNILITSGGTMEYLDPIRVITNLSSGKMGLAMINEAIRHGGKITHIVGNTNTSVSSGNFSHSKNDDLRTIKVNTSDEMYSKVVSELSSKKYDIVIFAAAVTDFKPMEIQNKKISSKISDSITFKFIPTKKIINEIKSIDKNLFLVGFKAYYNVSDSYLINKAKKKLNECAADIIVANDVGRKNTNIGSDYNEVFIVAKNNNNGNNDNDNDNQIIHLKVQSKESIAEKLFEVILSKLK